MKEKKQPQSGEITGYNPDCHILPPHLNTPGIAWNEGLNLVVLIKPDNHEGVWHVLPLFMMSELTSMETDPPKDENGLSAKHGT